MTKGENAAQIFFELLETGKLKKNILPNTSVDYTEMQEAIDTERYKYFLNSFAYDDLKNIKVRSYYGNE